MLKEKRADLEASLKNELDDTIANQQRQNVTLLSSEKREIRDEYYTPQVMRELWKIMKQRIFDYSEEYEDKDKRAKMDKPEEGEEPEP